MFRVIFLSALLIFLINFISGAVWTNDLNVDLIAYYTLNLTSGVVFDSLGLNNGTNNGATRGVTGMINASFQFDGVADFVNLSDVYDPLAGEFTYAFWFNNTDRDSTREHLFNKGDQQTGTGGIVEVRLETDNKLEFRLFDGGFDIFESTDTIVQDRWYFVVARRNSTNGIDVFMNNTLQATGTSTKNVNPNFNMQLGAAYQNGCCSTEFAGLIDEFAIWNRSLNDSEITDLWNDGAGITFIPTSVDSCTCPAINNDFNINMADFCVITVDCFLGTGRLNFTGAGNATFNATINTTSMGFPSPNSTLFIQDSCRININ